MAFYWEARAPPAPIQSSFRCERSPANGGAGGSRRRGGETASIAQMYICALAGGNPPVPSAACGRKESRHGPQEGE